MAQRLVRTLCPHCKKAEPLTPVDEATWDEMVTPWKSKKPTQIYRATGCLECRMTGYMGRVGIYEILQFTQEIKKIIANGADLDRIREQSAREGMKPLRISGAIKVASGLTTMEEILRNAPPVTN